MDNKIQKSILAGIIGTAFMTLIIMVAPVMGMPKMSPPKILSGMIGMPIFVGWIMHFIIGIVFAFAYTFLFKVNISNVWVKGAVFGVIVFVFAQIMMAILSAMIPMSAMEGSKVLLMMGSLMGHIVFGLAVAKTVGDVSYANQSSDIKNF